MLTLVSFTGADDATDINELSAFVHQYGERAEVALLYFPEKQGSARNPSAEQRERILSTVPRKNVAAHVCGSEAFRRILNHDDDIIADLSRYSRVQLNINARAQLFNTGEVLEVYQTLWENDISLILQHHEDSREVVESFAYRMNVYQYNRPSILFDGSRGKGIAPASWPRHLPYMYCGYAGGLGPSNVRLAYDYLEARAAVQICQPSMFWLDMETGVRTPDNQFSVERCREVMIALGL